MKAPLLFVLPALLLGQRASAQQLRVGVKAGLTFSGAGPVNLIGPQNILRVAAGAVGRYTLGPRERWRLQAELLNSGKGNESETVPGFYHRLSFFELPLLAQLHVGGLTLEAGPQLSYLFGSEYRDADEVHYERRGLRLGQVGYVAGLGGELSNNCHLTLRFARDLTSRLKPDPVRRYTGRYNYGVQVQLGYLLPARSV